jgi:hypothetical protein
MRAASGVASASVWGGRYLMIAMAQSVRLYRRAGGRPPDAAQLRVRLTRRSRRHQNPVGLQRAQRKEPRTMSNMLRAANTGGARVAAEAA